MEVELYRIVVVVFLESPHEGISPSPRYVGHVRIRAFAYDSVFDFL